jgi:phosphoribosyl-ATP pyrophosphohydrolase
VAGADRGATGERLAEESADLLYHLLVLLAERGHTPAEVVAILRSRHQ